MTTWMSVGKSRYRGDVLGVEQFMEQAAARQVLALIGFIATLPGCRRLTVNEGRRTRARQKTLRQRYEVFLRGGPWAPLAAVLYTSRHDEVNHGNAADLGGPNGEALNAAEIAAIKKYGPDFGVTFTGLTFSPPEPWHVEGDGRTPIPQYALASGSATPFPDQEEDMAVTDDDLKKITTALMNKQIPVAGGLVTVQEALVAAWTVDQALRNGGESMPDQQLSVAHSILGARTDIAASRKALGELIHKLVDDTTDEASIPRLSRAIGTRLTTAQGVLDKLLKRWGGA